MRVRCLFWVIGFVLLGGSLSGQVEREALDRSEMVINRLIRTAEDYLAARDYNRGVNMLETVLERFPESDRRFEVYLILGRHHFDQQNEREAITYLRRIPALAEREEAMTPEQRDIYLEGLLLTGKSYFYLRNFRSVFPPLRQITRDYPDSAWGNEAYYYIGMAHFAQENWSSAIEALSMVGTVSGEEAEAMERVEAGRRLYVKVEDKDLPILERLGESITVSLHTEAGDREDIELIPMSAGSSVFIGSIPTVVGVPERGDNRLQVVGGDTITVRYVDRNTSDGESNVERISTVEVVSTGRIQFVLGTFEGSASAAFIGQPIFLQLQDADLSTGPERNTVEVEVVSRYPVIDETLDQQEVDIEELLAEGEEEIEFAERDRITVRLVEHGEEPFHSGDFRGSIQIISTGAERSREGDLRVEVGDQVVVRYLDERHLGGDTLREVEAILPVGGEITGRPESVARVVTDPVLRARKNLVEATAYLELARIFNSMGLRQGARERAEIGLELVNDILREAEDIPVSIHESSFRIKWELELEMDNFPAALATARAFSALYPQSVLVDEAYLSIGRIKMAEHEYTEAIQVFEEILRHPGSMVRAEAQFRIAEAVEKQNPDNPGRAIPYFQRTAERFSQSEFAGQALAKMVDFHIENRNYSLADDLLGQIFEDHPDAEFLDSMLLKWVIVAFRMQNFERARDLCQRLIFEFPESPFASRAQTLLPRIEERL